MFAYRDVDDRLNECLIFFVGLTAFRLSHNSLFQIIFQYLSGSKIELGFSDDLHSAFSFLKVKEKTIGFDMARTQGFVFLNNVKQFTGYSERIILICLGELSRDRHKVHVFKADDVFHDNRRKFMRSTRTT